MITIKPKNLQVLPGRGKHCFMARIDGEEYRIFDVLEFNEINDETEKEFHWGDYPSEDKPYHGWSGLKEATIIQNICWYHGLAPRVYEIVGVEIYGKKYFAQRIEYLNKPFCETHKDAEPTYEAVKKLGETYGFHTEKDDVSNKDVMGGKLVDFNTFHFTEDHREKVMAIIREKGHYGKTIYQSEPKLDIISTPRNTEHRIKAMKLDEIDFKRKSVLDLGCAGGAFCRYSKDRGAREVLGIDFEDVIGTDTRLAAYLISWELGYFDIEFEAHDLRNVAIGRHNRDKFKYMSFLHRWDIIFFLSMSYHIGIPDWLGDITNELLIFEENSRNFKEDPQVTKNTIKKLKTMFRKVERVGQSEDREPQPIFWCYK